MFVFICIGQQPGAKDFEDLQKVNVFKLLIINLYRSIFKNILLSENC